MSIANAATSGQAKHCLTLIDDQQLTIPEMEAVLLYLPHLCQGVKGGTIPPIDDFRKLFNLPPVEMITEVDFGMTLEQMIAAGNYDWTNDDITAARFPVEGTGKKKFRNKVFHFGRNISSEDAVAAMKKERFLPGGHVHGTAFGAKFPDEQRKYPIACLGSSAQVLGGRGVVCLCRHGAKRRLGLDGWYGGWDGDWRFLGVQEVSDA